MLGLGDDVRVTAHHQQAQRHTEAMRCKRCQLPPGDVDGRQQKPREHGLESKCHQIVGTGAAQTKEIHLRQSTEVYAACENEGTELTKAITPHFLSAYCSVRLG